MRDELPVVEPCSPCCMNAELRELAILRAARARDRATKEANDATPFAAASSGGPVGSLLFAYDDVVLSILEQLCMSRDVASLVSCLASSKSLSSFSRDLLREHFPLHELIPELLTLPTHLQSHVSERCRELFSLGGLPSGLMRGSLYSAVRTLLYGELPPDLVWLVLQQWSGTLEEELTSMADAHRRWRIGCAGLPGRHYRLGGLDAKGAADHFFSFHGEQTSVADYFADHMQQPLRRSQLPCILAGPRSSLGLIRLPLELLYFVGPDEPADPAAADHVHVAADDAAADTAAAADNAASRPQPDAILAMPPALRALVEYVSRDNILRPLDCD